MKNYTALFLSVLSLSGFVHAAKDIKFGPMPHERTDTPKKSKANVGRYLYVGVEPKFAGEEIELTVAKMSLNLRATGWVTQAKIDNYANELFNRWSKIDNALNDPDFILHPLVKIESLPTKDTSIAWAKIAAQYSAHVLEDRGVEIYNAKRNAKSLEEAGNKDEYRDNISLSILRYFFNDNSLTADQLRNDNQLRDIVLSAANSRKLFQAHHPSNFTKSSAKEGYVGFITTVYPVAATVAGPFDQPKEGQKRMEQYGTIDARWWSDKWNDEFGGLPFILINPAGVAFHGPITNFNPLDVWYLRRGYVSHGCHRMDTSDVIELRNMLPTNTTELGKVKITILNYFDVADVNADGQQEVIDVKYYNVPGAVTIAKGQTIDAAIKPYLVENQMKSYFASNAYGKQFYDAATDTIKNAPKYKLEKGVLSKDGTHPSLPIMRFPYPKNRVLQYKETNMQFVPYDDNRGDYPPKYFFN